MSQRTVPFKHFYIVVGDFTGAESSPQIFRAPCGLTSKSFNQTASTQDTVIPPCDDVDALAFTGREKDALSSEISGDGVLSWDDHHETWQPWLFSSTPKNVRIGIGSIPDPLVGGYYEGPYHLTTLNMSGERGQKLRGAVTLVSDGEWEFVQPITSPVP